MEQDDLESDQVVRPRIARVIVLVVSYVVIAGAVWWFADLARERFGYYQGWIFVQAVVIALLLLLGLWLILGAGVSAGRAFSCIFGLIYSAALISSGSTSTLLSTATLMVIFFPLSAIAAYLVIHKYWKVRVKNVDAITPDGREAFQFSILHLLGLTVLVGCLLSLANGIREYEPGPGRFVQWERLSISQAKVLGVLVLCISNLVIAITSLWATLSLARPWPRVCFLFAMAVCLGMLYPYVEQKNLSDYPNWVVASLVTTVLVAVALLVVRSNGTRLIKDVENQ